MLEATKKQKTLRIKISGTEEMVSKVKRFVINDLNEPDCSVDLTFKTKKSFGFFSKQPQFSNKRTNA
jgi:hypothetical protein